MSEKSQMRTQYYTLTNNQEIAVLDWKEGISTTVPTFRRPTGLKRALEKPKNTKLWSVNCNEKSKNDYI